MNARDLQDALIALFERLADARDEIEGDDDDIPLADIARDIAIDFEGMTHAQTYADAQILTSDSGLVVRTSDGAEFQITIVQTRRGTGGDEDDGGRDD
jgi:hypothetical protein